MKATVLWILVPTCTCISFSQTLHGYDNSSRRQTKTRVKKQAEAAKRPWRRWGKVNTERKEKAKNVLTFTSSHLQITKLPAKKQSPLFCLPGDPASKGEPLVQGCSPSRRQSCQTHHHLVVPSSPMLQQPSHCNGGVLSFCHPQPGCAPQETWLHQRPWIWCQKHTLWKPWCGAEERHYVVVLGGKGNLHSWKQGKWQKSKFPDHVKWCQGGWGTPSEYGRWQRVRVDSLVLPCAALATALCTALCMKVNFP